MRKECSDAGTTNTTIAVSLAGLDSERAWNKRRELSSLGVEDMYIILGTNGDYNISPRIICKNQK